MRICKIEGCNKSEKAKGYCTTHHQRLLRTGDPLGTKRALSPICAMENCNNRINTREQRYCYYHRRHPRKTIYNCSVEGCHRRHTAKGLCHLHYNKLVYQKKRAVTRVSYALRAILAKIER